MLWLTKPLATYVTFDGHREVVGELLVAQLGGGDLSKKNDEQVPELSVTCHVVQLGGDAPSDRAAATVLHHRHLSVAIVVRGDPVDERS